MSSSNALHCINRNIVECKVALPDTLALSNTVLIETLWNVKISNGSNGSMLSSINRNIVECKDGD